MSPAAAAEALLRRDLVDLEALARCEALDAAHPLRREAAALWEAFAAATSGETVAPLAEVRRRSPLAPWKMLVRALEAFHRGEDEACLRALEGVDAESAPGRLASVVRGLVRGEPAEPSREVRALREAVVGGDFVRAALRQVDDAVETTRPRRVLEAVESAVRAVREGAPGLEEELRRRVAARCGMIGVEEATVRKALGGPVRKDARYWRQIARTQETAYDPMNALLAGWFWEHFLVHAVAEGWFTAGGVEKAAVMLQVAGTLEELPGDLLRQVRGQIRRQHPSQGDGYDDQPAEIRVVGQRAPAGRGVARFWGGNAEVIHGHREHDDQNDQPDRIPGAPHAPSCAREGGLPDVIEESTV